MALPIVPLLLGAAALLVLGKKKSTTSGGEPGYAPGGPGGGPSGGGGGVTSIKRISAAPGKVNAWGYCAPPAGSPKGTYAALGPNGECVVFWNPQTWKVMRDILSSEFSKLSNMQKKDICNLDECIPNPYASEAELFCEWKPNPRREAFVIRSIGKAFPQLGSENFPANDSSPYFPKMVWTFASNLFASEFCGIGRET